MLNEVVGLRTWPAGSTYSPTTLGPSKVIGKACHKGSIGALLCMVKHIHAGWVPTILSLPTVPDRPLCEKAHRDMLLTCRRYGLLPRIS